MEVRGAHNGTIDFVAIGHLAVDLLGGERVPGGAAAYGCLAAARLGRTTAMVTSIGDDLDLFELLKGIEIHYHPSPESTTFRNAYRATKREQRILGRARPLTESDLSPLRARVADEATILYCPIAQEVEAPLVPFEPGGLCGVAPQGFLRTWNDDGLIHPCSWEKAALALAEASLVSMSESDAPRSRDLARNLTTDHRIVALTEGARGARVYTGGRCFRVPAYSRPEREPTGAGDVFAASFLVALSEGQEVLDAAQFASCAASFTVESPGLSGVFQSRAEVEVRLEDYRSQYQPEEIEP